MVDEFARVVLSHGTTAVVSGPARDRQRARHRRRALAARRLRASCRSTSTSWRPRACRRAPSSRPAGRSRLGDMESILRRRRALGVAEMMNFPAVIAGDPAELAKLALRDASHADGHAPGVDGAGAAGVRRGRHPLRPRGLHLRGGAGQAARGPVGADPRGVQRPQPRRPAAAGARVRPGELRLLHRRPRAGLPGARGAHGPDVPRGRRARHRARGRAAADDPPPRALPRPGRRGRHRAGLPRRPGAARRPRRVPRRPRVEGRRPGRGGRARTAAPAHRGARLGAPDRARGARRPGRPAPAVARPATCG